MIRLSGVGNALAAAIEARGVRGVGEQIDEPKSNVHSWGADPSRWSFAAGLALAAEDPEVRAAVLDALDGAAPRGRPSELTRDAFALTIGGNRTLASISEHLADGNYSPAEGRDDLPVLRGHAAKVRRLILDVEAVAAAGGQIGGAR